MFLGFPRAADEANRLRAAEEEDSEGEGVDGGRGAREGEKARGT